MSDNTKILVKRRSDQWNNEDFITGPKTFTIAAVHDGKAEGPYDIELVEGEGKVWRPPNSVLEALVLAWGTNERADWVGRKVTLYRDPEVRMGRHVVGGIRVSHVSHIDKATTVRVTVARGKKSPVTLKPIPTEPTAEQVAACTDDQVLREWWGISSPERQAQIKARAAELKNAATEPTQPTLDDEGVDQ